MKKYNCIAEALPSCEGMSKEEMAQEVSSALKKFYYEDVEFFHKLIVGYAEKKGIKI